MKKKLQVSTLTTGVSCLLFLAFSVYSFSGLFPYIEGTTGSAAISVMSLFLPDLKQVPNPNPDPGHDPDQQLPAAVTTDEEDSPHIPVFQEDIGIAQLETDTNNTHDEIASTNTSNPQSNNNDVKIPPDNPNNPRYKVLEKKLPNEGANYKNIWVLNETTAHSLNIQETLAKSPAVHTKKNGTPQVLIFHTHTTESYAPNFSGYYNQDDDTRTTDKSKNVTAVGEVLAQKLRDAGIGVIHDTTYHDYPAYRGSYSRSEQTVAQILKDNPTIEVVIDVHRNSMVLADNTKIKPTTEINGKKAAQIGIISGSQDETSLYFPNWEYNLRLALRLQQQTATMYPGLIVPMRFVPYRYNMHLSKGSILIEVGAEVNTLDEALYSADMFGDALVKVMEDLQV